eukprot:GHVU01227161.1.p2 GENE.GHVU01227161.1~~GHVU01227161.1.p2  ORF type:complete len:108 (-),score=0.10 GHVU01227161.1:1180-1503(-)
MFIGYIGVQRRQISGERRSSYMAPWLLQMLKRSRCRSFATMRAVLMGWSDMRVGWDLGREVRPSDLNGRIRPNPTFDENGSWKITGVLPDTRVVSNAESFGVNLQSV